jgi:hypothetical protein
MSRDQRRVILFGDSLVLEGVRASLKACPNLEVLLLSSSIENPFEFIRSHSPATFIFDLEAVQPNFQLSLFQQPGLLLIGIDPETHHALVWSGRQAAAMVAADLVKVIRQQDSSAEENNLT